MIPHTGIRKPCMVNTLLPWRLSLQSNIQKTIIQKSMKPQLTAQP